MTRTRLVKGKLTETTGGKDVSYAKEDIVFNSSKKIIFTATNGLSFGDPDVGPKKTSTTQVKEIELLSDLDSGASNDKSGGTQDGFIFGNTYKFKVKSFSNGEPFSEKMIKWMYRYHNLSTNKWVDVFLNTRGENVSLRFNNKEMCGRYIYIRSYIDDEEKEGELKIWKHNRFRYFDRKIIEDEIKDRKQKPYLANQKNTSLCGMAAIMYLLAKQNFQLYKKFNLELHRTGYFKFEKYSVNVSEKSTHLLKMNPITNLNYPKDYEGIMPYCDWISFASIRDQENNIRDFDGEDDFSFDGATLPNEIKKLMKGILGYSNIIDNTNLIMTKGALQWDGEASSSREIAKMNELTKQGFSVVMLVNTNMIEKEAIDVVKGKIRYTRDLEPAKKSGLLSTLEHWVVFDEIIGGSLTWDEFDFKIFTWGTMKDIIIKPEIFSTNYYGYVYGK